ncbi:hypothetical protein GPECTOR_6g670 [Gonium pectorale]|uniref:Uncharacterized protein n=1 Tax=Gonium pectorale TaxID=33097 RepID=A0A150GVG5_GONPE|nr:hypothetical protein GPECTOR_6g670 [Gonium pectorale]|eukprot:KXZ53753.1 hypothetical protein GPECTOR_6g670 [Gonium pectorale]
MTATEDLEASAESEEEPNVLLWRRFSLSQYLSSVSPSWRRVVGCFEYSLVGRPSNDKSLGLQGWRSGRLRRWELRFPVLSILDSPGQAKPGEGFHEWPLFDVFKIDLRDLAGWPGYLASLKRADRWNVRQRCKLFHSFESDGRLLKHGKQRGRGDGFPPGADCPPPPLPPLLTPGSAPEAEALLEQLWGLYEQTGARNGFVECTQQHFKRLLREAPGVQVAVIRQGPGGAASGGAVSPGGASRPSCSPGAGPILAFGVLLPQRESLQVLYVGMQYDNPLVRQSSCYFQILTVGLLVALTHNETVRQRAAAAAALAKELPPGTITAGTGMAPAAATVAAPDSAAVITAAAATAALPPQSPYPGAITAVADGTAAGIGADAALARPPTATLTAVAHAAVAASPLGARPGLIDTLDLGPGRRFVKEHLGAAGHPISMYTRGIGPIADKMSCRLLGRYFTPRQYLNDP